MGGGDLNMKKSWHPLLQVNQERVWKREKEAIEERKKLEELRREREQEREMQELQRLQEEAGGKKRVDKVDWMYATPATTGSNSAAEMEDYLLGKKRVDKLLQGEENKEVSKSSQKSLISLQSANSARDLAAKVREDPMLAIKQQEQEAYEALLRDPARLRQLKMQAGIDVNSESKEERRRRKEEKRRRHEERDRRSRHDDEDRRRRPGSSHSSSHHESRSHRHQEDRNSRDRASNHRDGESSRRRHRDEEPRFSRRHDTDDREHHRRSRSYREGAFRDEDSYRSRSSRSRSPPSRAAQKQDEQRKEEMRQQKLREMEQNARSMEEQRSSYVSKINAEEAEQEKREAALRQKLLDARSKGHSDGKGVFLADQQQGVAHGMVAKAEEIATVPLDCPSFADWPIIHYASAHLHSKPLVKGPVINTHSPVDSDCLTCDHQVLTRKGRKNVAEVQTSDFVMTINRQTRAQVWQHPISCHTKKHDGQLYRTHSFGVDAFFTPDHLLLVILSAAKDGMELRSVTQGGTTTEATVHP
ncbi:CBF1-interacting co-repressor CIR, N-terminal domain protein [Kalmanozyma brasiliensis GHG001]|uniref:CBF1-interacting co-repressor CIR, N-terminal domain protein n=1 Tax=Kalmanozyma brasiliensis (strain GHG001) TaxID=1365824 RepID=UPI0028682C44|nr:CBF1-interacting co-repressor CIR, N-terminal domain protein [Kalmanozyma brasiliensis GHG001]EST08968.2 CBF1-interacting co-repressor CIR, N-terminal domain protein [Kalmanozyma brasiliensis GHG001]